MNRFHCLCCFHYILTVPWWGRTKQGQNHSWVIGVRLLKNVYLLCIYGCAGSLLLHLLFSSCSKWGLLSSYQAWVSRCSGFSCCGVQVSILVACGLRSCGSQALWCVCLVAVACRLSCPTACGYSCTRDGTRVSWIGRWILYPWATREALEIVF